MTVPNGYKATHPVAPAAPAVSVQLMPPGGWSATTEPLPPPPPPIVSTALLGEGANVAITVCLTDMVIEQPALPLQAPVHRRNVCPAAGVAVRVTTVPSG